MLPLLVGALLSISASAPHGVQGVPSASQAAPGQHSAVALLTSPIDQAGQDLCTQIGAGAEFSYVAFEDHDEWLAERAPAPKDDYETPAQYEQRRIATWRELLAANPVIVISYNMQPTRENSQYDPATQVLTIRAPSSADCFGQEDWQCLELAEGVPLGYHNRYLAIRGLEKEIRSPLNMAPAAARRLREEDRLNEVTLFLVTTIVPPYATLARSGPYQREFFHVGAYCAHYFWDD